MLIFQVCYWCISNSWKTNFVFLVQITDIESGVRSFVIPKGEKAWKVSLKHWISSVERYVVFPLLRKEAYFFLLALIVHFSVDPFNLRGLLRRFRRLWKMIIAVGGSDSSVKRDSPGTTPTVTESGFKGSLWRSICGSESLFSWTVDSNKEN